jgi:hypothetical protein
MFIVSALTSSPESIGKPREHLVFSFEERNRPSYEECSCEITKFSGYITGCSMSKTRITFNILQLFGWVNVQIW